jgi:phage gp29-like protein
MAAMMEAMSSAAWGIAPDGSKVEFHESSKSGADNPQAYMLTLADTACDLLVLGQTLTGSVGDSGSRALGEVHAAVRADIIDSAAVWLAEVLNEQLVPAVIALNYGEVDEDSSLPWFQPMRKSKKETKTMAETFEIVLRSGIPVRKDEVYDALDLSKPEPGDDVFTTPATPPALTGGAAEVSPEVRRALAKMPLDAREYFMARLRE